MLQLTLDQSLGLDKMINWYEKKNHQSIIIVSPFYSNPLNLISCFISGINNLQMKEIKFLTTSQKEIIDFGKKGYDIDYIPEYIYDHYYINKHGIRKDYSKLKRNVPIRNYDVDYKFIVVLGAQLLTNQDIINIGKIYEDVPIIVNIDPFSILCENDIIHNNKCIHLSDFDSTVGYLGKLAYDIINDNNYKLLVGKYPQYIIIEKEKMNQLDIFNKIISGNNIYIPNEYTDNGIEFPDADQINEMFHIMYTNKRGYTYNPTLPSRKFLSGEKVRCLTDNWYSSLDRDKYFLTNGMIGNIYSTRYNATDRLYTGSFKLPFTDQKFDHLIFNVENYLLDDDNIRFKLSYSDNIFDLIQWRFDIIYTNTKKFGHNIHDRLGLYNTIRIANKLVIFI